MTGWLGHKQLASIDEWNKGNIKNKERNEEKRE